MERFNPQGFYELLHASHPRSVSIYLPTPEVGADGNRRDVQLRDLVEKVLDQLKSVELKKNEHKNVMKVVDEMLSSDEFWRQGNKGFAIFVSPHLQKWYRLPIDILPLAIVSYRFHLKPLIPLVTEHEDFYLLSLSKQRVELFCGDRYGLHKEEVVGMPKDLEEVVGTDTGERQLQFHTRSTSSSGGRRPAVYHGQSSWKDDKQKYLNRFLQQVDNAVTKHLETQKAPLILSGVEKMLTEYVIINTYPHLLKEVVLQGNREGDSLKNLHTEALQKLQSYFYDQERAKIEKYLTHGSPRRISTKIDEILRQARMGKVDTVLVARGVRKWGKFDENTLAVDVEDKQTPQNHDLFDLACAETMLNGGTAYVLPPEFIPTPEPIAAVFRY